MCAESSVNGSIDFVRRMCSARISRKARRTSRRHVSLSFYAKEAHDQWCYDDTILSLISFRNTFNIGFRWSASHNTSATDEATCINITYDINIRISGNDGLVFWRQTLLQTRRSNASLTHRASVYVASHLSFISLLSTLLQNIATPA